jgi:hypothetical protein
LISEPTRLWEFDTATRSDSAVILGLLNSETNGIGGFTRSNSYDNIGRVTSVLTSEDNLTYTERQTYDQFGRPYQHFDASTDALSANGELIENSTDGYRAGHRPGSAISSDRLCCNDFEAGSNPRAERWHSDLRRRQRRDHRRRRRCDGHTYRESA